MRLASYRTALPRRAIMLGQVGEIVKTELSMRGFQTIARGLLFITR